MPHRYPVVTALELGRGPSRSKSVSHRQTVRQADMAFVNDFDGLSQTEQTAQIQAVAREHGDQLTELEAGPAPAL